jgi:alkylation response protein AidB-like acyl-CoA dehydrogenase
VTEESVDTFRARAAAWLTQNRQHAPRDYGAICPPSLIEEAKKWQRLIFDSGFAGLHWPTEHGGQGLSPAFHGAWVEECAKVGVPPVLNMVGLVLAGGAVMTFGTDELKQQHLRSTLSAEHVWCQLFSEPGAGSDLGSLSTRADKDGDRFIINGQQVWCSGGRCSNWGILMARTDFEAKKHEGISFFLIPMDLPGIEVRPLKQMTGESEFDEVFFTDVELPAEFLIGPLHGGWGVGTRLGFHTCNAGVAVARCLGNGQQGHRNHHSTDRGDQVQNDLRVGPHHFAGGKGLSVVLTWGHRAFVAPAIVPWPKA